MKLNPSIFESCNFLKLKRVVFDLCELAERPTPTEMIFLGSIVSKAPNLEQLELQQSLENPKPGWEHRMLSSQIEDLFETALQGSRASLFMPAKPVDPEELSTEHLRRLIVQNIHHFPSPTGPPELHEHMLRMVLENINHRLQDRQPGLDCTGAPLWFIVLHQPYKIS